MANKFIVAVRSRPLIEREKSEGLSIQWKIEDNTIECISPLLKNHRYTFDYVYDAESTSLEIYKQVAEPIVQEFVKGVNGTILAYGQSSSGKTHTMFGNLQNPGIIRLAARQIFKLLRHLERNILIELSFFEIYNEKVYDLLNGRKELQIRELVNGEIAINCPGKIAKNEGDVLRLVDNGNNHRQVARTEMNIQSSRSHAILQISIQSLLSKRASRGSVLNLVDLAGTERAESEGERLKEASSINTSLFTLSKVIDQLIEKSQSRSRSVHISYRESKLTRILQTSLGGHSMTAMICTITPAAVEKTSRTLHFATRAKKIENKSIINETMDDPVEVKRLKKKIHDLESQLESQKKQLDLCQKHEMELEMLKRVFMHTQNKLPIPASQRRKTLTGGLEGPSNANPDLSNELVPIEHKIENADDGLAQIAVVKLKFDDNGHRVECQNEDWDSFIKDTIGKLAVVFDVTAVNRATVLDKDERIRSLESELDELRHS